MNNLKMLSAVVVIGTLRVKFYSLPVYWQSDSITAGRIIVLNHCVPRRILQTNLSNFSVCFGIKILPDLVEVDRYVNCVIKSFLIFFFL